MRVRKWAPLAAALLAPIFMPVASAQADEADYLARFKGSWSGGGSMRPTANAPNVPLDCSASGDAGGSTLALGGRCGALVVSRTISAQLSYDPSSGRYTGIYIAEGDPPAALYGTRAGDALVLAVRWPKPVNGDSNATMIIRNPGTGRFTFTVRDAAEPGGPAITTANFTLSRTGDARR